LSCARGNVTVSVKRFLAWTRVGTPSDEGGMRFLVAAGGSTHPVLRKGIKDVITEIKRALWFSNHGSRGVRRHAERHHRDGDTCERSPAFRGHQNVECGYARDRGGFGGIYQTARRARLGGCAPAARPCGLFKTVQVAAVELAGRYHNHQKPTEAHVPASNTRRSFRFWSTGPSAQPPLEHARPPGCIRPGPSFLSVTRPAPGRMTGLADCTTVDATSSQLADAPGCTSVFPT